MNIQIAYTPKRMHMHSHLPLALATDAPHTRLYRGQQLSDLQ